MGELRIPIVVAVGFWLAAGLAVTTYTLTALKETATGLEGSIIIGADPLLAGAAVLSAELDAPKKPLERNRFPKSK